MQLGLLGVEEKKISLTLPFMWLRSLKALYNVPKLISYQIKGA